MSAIIALVFPIAIRVKFNKLFFVWAFVVILALLSLRSVFGYKSDIEEFYNKFVGYSDNENLNMNFYIVSLIRYFIIPIGMVFILNKV